MPKPSARLASDAAAPARFMAERRARQRRRTFTGLLLTFAGAAAAFTAAGSIMYEVARVRALEDCRSAARWFDDSRDVGFLIMQHPECAAVIEVRRAP